MTALDDYVGIPWLERGRDREGCDCWGLLAMVLSDRFGVALPSYRDDYQTVKDTAAIVGLIDGHMDEWVSIADGQEREGDGLLMSIAGRPRHVGIVVSPGLVLHIERGVGSLIENYRCHRLRHRLVGFYRHVSLA